MRVAEGNYLTANIVAVIGSFFELYLPSFSQITHLK